MGPSCSFSSSANRQAWPTISICVEAVMRIQYLLPMPERKRVPSFDLGSQTLQLKRKQDSIEMFSLSSVIPAHQLFMPAFELPAFFICYLLCMFPHLHFS